MKILLICTGNTCRSSMAEALLKAKIEKQKRTDITVTSAGIAALPNMPASKNAIEVMDELGIDLSSHRSKLISPKLLEADLILTMTTRHRDILRFNFPELANRIYALKGYISPNCDDLDIIDPYGASVAIYRDTATFLSQLLDKLLVKIAKSS